MRSHERLAEPAPFLFTATLLIALSGAVGCRAQPEAARPPLDQLPKLTKEGALSQPVGWETWVMVGSSTGLSYNTPGAAPAQGAAPGLFHNVYLQPWAYREFIRNGVFPDGSMFVLAFYEASQKASPARAGFYEGDRAPGFEVHLKQAGIDSTG
ncbi:MAG: cytochrome P460 family protein [Gemmatimonadales bacterium]